jgi:hypothetical protein
MRRILLLTVGILVACFPGVVNAGDLDGRYADSPLHDWLIVSRVVAVPMQMENPSLTRLGIMGWALPRPLSRWKMPT